MDRKGRDKDPRSAKVKLAALRKEYNELFKDTVARSTQLQELKKSKRLLQAEVNFLRKRVRLLRSPGSTGAGDADAKVMHHESLEDLPVTSDDHERVESEGQEEEDPSSNGLAEYDEDPEEPDPDGIEQAGTVEPVDTSSEEISGFTMSRSASPPQDEFATGESHDFGREQQDDEAESASTSDDDLDAYAQDSDRSS